MKHLKNSFVLLLTLFMLMGSSVCKAVGEFYAVKINSIEEFKNFRDNVNNDKEIETYLYNPTSKTWHTYLKLKEKAAKANVFLTNDIDLSGQKDWIPIGTGGIYYSGNFYGEGHKITVPASCKKNSYEEICGVFGTLNNAGFYDLTVSGQFFETAKYTGLLAGKANHCYLNNCNAEATIRTEYDYVGGFIGYVENGVTIVDCVTSGSIQSISSRYTGGMVGAVSGPSIITNSINYANVSGYEFVGGFIGHANYDKLSGTDRNVIDFSSCLNYGKIEVKTYTNNTLYGSNVGGFVGYVEGRSDYSAKISYSANLNDVTAARTYAGGMIGHSKGIIVEINNSYVSCTISTSLGTASQYVGVFWGSGDKAPKITNSGYLLAYTEVKAYNKVVENLKYAGKGWNNDGEATYELNEGVTNVYPKWYQNLSKIGSRPTLTKNSSHYVFRNYTHGTSENPKYQNSDNYIHPDPHNLKSHDVFHVDSYGNIKCTTCNKTFTKTDLTTGTFEIKTLEDLKQFRDIVNSCSATLNGVLMADINILGNNWTPIGTYTNPFKGKFDGQKHLIYNFKITSTNKYVGLFGYSRGNICNLTVNGNVTNNNNTDIDGHTGLIAGWQEGKLENCTTQGSVTAPNCNSTGGLVGTANNSEIISCTNEATVSGKTAVGGIAGAAKELTLYYCKNIKSINGSAGDIGGLIGFIYSGFTLTLDNCENSGSVSGDIRIGGIVGSTRSELTIKTCNNYGAMTGRAAVGGIIGALLIEESSFNLQMSKCSNNGNAKGTGGHNLGGLVGYVGKNLTTTFDECYNTADIKGESTSQDVGGLVGYLQSNATFTSCYSSATVYGEDGSTGGVIGCISSDITTSATNCYFNSDKNSKAIGLRTLSTGNFTGATTKDFASGKVAYDLNNGNTTNPIYTQKIGLNNSPTLYSSTNNYIVYPHYSHGSNTYDVFSNKIEDYHNKPNSEYNHNNSIEQETGICRSCNVALYPPYISGCYEISTPEHLVLFANMVNKGSTTIKGILKNNIYLKDNFTPIGNSTNPFNGTFDGAGYTISNLKISANSLYVGLFGYSKGVIRNLTVSGNVTNDFNSPDKSSFTGMIVGRLEGTIENCYTSGSVTVPNGCAVGGLAGSAAKNFEIKSCGNNATVKGIHAIGGIVGRANLDKDNSLLEKCYNTGTITGTGNNIGGLIGYVYSDNTQRNVTFENCYNTGAIKGESTSGDVGGLVGWIITNATFTSCYSSANVEGKSASTGATIGAIEANLNVTATNCYFNSDKNSKAIGNRTLSIGEFTGATTAEFESGAITYALNNGNTEDPVFRQKLGVNPTSITIGTGNIIYAYYDHGSDIGTYSNAIYTTKHTTPDSKADHDSHIDETGKCSICYKNYEIDNYERLLKFATLVRNGKVNIKAKLTNDIVANKQLLNANGGVTGVLTEIWTPINNFKGEFDGQGHTISGLYVDNKGNAGLFENLIGATIKNVHIVDSYFKGATVGAICVTAQSGTKINRCSNQSTVEGTNAAAICHNAMSVSISYCYNTGAKVPLVGVSLDKKACTIENCYNAKYGKEETNVTYTNSYYLADEYATDGGCTESQFNNGVVCWLLNGKKETNDVIWRQNQGDKYPSFEGAIVTKAKMHCDHVYGSDFKCLICGDRKQLEVEGGFCLIHNFDDLTLFALKVNEDKETTIKARLTNNIVANKQLLNASGDVTGVPAEIWTPINNFKGEFDGQGYTISGLYVNDAKEDVGLFYRLDGATIKNVHIADSYFKGNIAAAICVIAEGGTKIYRCSNQSTIEGNNFIGAICSMPMQVSISYCYNTGANVPLVGMSLDKDACIIENCYNAKYGKEKGNLTYTNSYYLADEYATDGGCTESQFANGEVCWLLNGKKETSDVIWRQNQGDKYPSFEGAVVKGSEKKYNELHLSDEECDFANGKSYETVTYTRKVNSDAHSAHWGTVCLPFSFNESNCAGGVKFYEVTKVTENGIELNQITHVEAGQAVMFYNAGDWSVSVGGPVVIRNTVNEGDPMIGTYQQKAVEVGSNNYFYVKENKFYKGNTSFNVPAFHAYLEGTGVNSLSSFSIVRDNVMEEAEEETAEAKTISAIYTANGQRVSEMNGKGVYIVVFSDGTSKKVHIVE